MKIETKIQLEHRLNNQVKQQTKNRINERMETHIKNFKNKNKTMTNTSNTKEQEEFTKLMDHEFNNNTNLKLIHNILHMIQK